jgi:hypothetical protein
MRPDELTLFPLRGRVGFLDCGVAFFGLVWEAVVAYLRVTEGHGRPTWGVLWACRCLVKIVIG